MTEPEINSVDKTKIVEQIADLSRLLGMIPSDDTIAVNEPVTHNSMVEKYVQHLTGNIPEIYLMYTCYFRNLVTIKM